MARRTFRRTSRKKKNFAWTGGVIEQAVPDAATFVALDQRVLIDDQSDLFNSQAITIERIIANFSSRRLLTGSVQAYAYGFSMIPVDQGGVLLDVINPLSANPFEWANQRIMNTGFMDVPATLIDGFVGGRALANAAICHEVDFKPRRRMTRSNTALVVGITSNAVGAVDFTIEVTLRFRILFSWP